MGPKPVQTLFDEKSISEMLSRLAGEIAGNHADIAELALVGIRTGGAHLARRLRADMGRLTGKEPLLGIVDITLYRDDWTRLHSRPKVGRTQIDFSTENRKLVLIDDVLFTGRTVRAAMDAIIDYGRPRLIELAVLIDRGHRELPIQPDYVGQVLETSRKEMIDVLLAEEGADHDGVVKRLG